MNNKNEIRIRILKLKKRLPRGYVKILEKKYPNRYHSHYQKHRLRQVVALQLLNEKIVKDLEKIVL